MITKIRILSTSDIHGIVFPYRYSDNEKAEEGFAKLKTLIDSLRDDDTIIIDNGDTIAGSAFTRYHFSTRQDELCPISSVMKKIRYDYVVPGNHDFEYGEETLLRHLNATGAICLCANFFYRGQLLGPEYVIKTIEGKKLALFGLTSQCVSNQIAHDKLIHFSFTDAFETAQKLVQKLKEEIAADYVVCIYHGGFENDPETGEPLEGGVGENEAYRMCRQISGLSAIMTGHQHRTMCGKLDGVAYTMPAANGSYLASIEIDTQTGETTPSLIPADKDPDNDVMNICKKEEDEVRKWLDTPLGRTEHNLIIRDEYKAHLQKSQLVTLINKILVEVSGADLAATSLHEGVRGLDKQITLRSLMNTFFFADPLIVKKINGKILKEYLEKTAEFWMAKDGKIIINPRFETPVRLYQNYDMVDGIEYTIKVSDPLGERITELTRNGEPVNDEDEFTIAMSSFRANGNGGYDMFKDAETVKEFDRSIPDIVMEYIKEKDFIDFEEKENIKVVL